MVVNNCKKCVQNYAIVYFRISDLGGGRGKWTLLLLLCQNPNYKCYLGQCDACPKNEVLQDAIIEILHKNLVQSVVHKYWVSKPRTILKTTNVTPQEFALNFCTSGRIFLHHSFIGNEQASFYKLSKKIYSDECIVVCDFAENYAFVIQNTWVTLE